MGSIDRRILLSFVTVLCVAVLGGLTPPAYAQPDKPKLGLKINEPTACKGYTLLAPINSNKTYLVDMDGHVVQTWKSDCNAGLDAYLLENGHLLRSGVAKNPPGFGLGGGGHIQEFTWDGKLDWDFEYANETQYPHHDVCKLPNGNILLIVWEKKPAKEAIAAGRRPETVGKSHMLADSILEFERTGEKTGKLVWEWHTWDHLVQDFDKEKANYGEVAEHPELIDLNFGEGTIAAMVAKPEELEKLRGIGYVGGSGRKPRAQADWLHMNSVTYNPELDQILVGSHEFSEFWIIDHSTTTAEAAAHKGGRYGKGGDLLYRWGNPRAYRTGTIKDQKLFGQHNAHWIGKGLNGEGHVLVFNNGLRRTGGTYSTIDEIVLPVDKKGNYELDKGKAYGPEKPVWSYAAQKRADFYAAIISGAQRLPNGDTLICSGTDGTVFEVNGKNETVWKFVNPAKAAPLFGAFQGFGPSGTPKLGQLVPPSFRGILNCSDDQKKQLEEAESELAKKLGALLTDEQKKTFAQGSRGFGELVPASTLDRLNLTDEQGKELAGLQKDADKKIEAILNDDQRKQLKQIQDIAKSFDPAAGGPLAGFGFGSGGGSALFRAPRYLPDYPGLKDRDLKPGKTIEELEAVPPKDAPKESKDK